TLEKLGNYAGERQISLFQAAGELGLQQVLSGRSLERLQRFCQAIEKTAERCERESPIPVIKQLFTDIEYDQWLYQNANTPKQAERRMENVWILVSSLQRMLEDDRGTDEEQTLQSAISRLILRDMLEQQA